MPRRKQNESLIPLDNRDDLLDQVFDKGLRVAQTRCSKRGIYTEARAAHVGLPVPALSVRWFLGMTAFILGKITLVVGPTGSFKSTFAMEVLRWHCLSGGRGIRFENEAKEPDASWLYAILRWNKSLFRPCKSESLEDWQKGLTIYRQSLQREFLKANKPACPVCFIVDSIAGTASVETVKNVEKVGSGDRAYPIEAAKNTQYLKVFPSKIDGWPFSLICVNHESKKIQTGFQLGPQIESVERQVMGGRQWRFRESLEIECIKLGKMKTFGNFNKINLKLVNHKNSYGPDGRSLNVSFSVWNQEDKPGVIRMHSRFEWWEATTELLVKLQESGYKINSVLDIHVKRVGGQNRYWSEAMGIDSDEPLTAHEFGVKLESMPELLMKLYPILGITPVMLFEPGVEYAMQQNSASKLNVHARLIKEELDRRNSAEATAALDSDPTPADIGVESGDSNDEEEFDDE